MADFSSSSSLSSLSSSTSSSPSDPCPCNILYCDGSACTHFVTWNINGLNYGNSDGCRLYVVFDNFGLIQQVELYKDSICSQLVGIGQGLGAGTIALDARNDSGLYGSVVWDGVITTYPSTTIISCFEFSSSSSSSSSSSMDSPSTSSHSTLSESSFSISSNSSSSSSSMDSHSTLSESSFSTSSSSSGCCANPICDGDGCAHFSGWTLSGSNKHNTLGCSLFVEFEYIYSNQEEIRLYNDPSLASAYLVATGQGVAGTITLSARNASGLTGSVIWDGVPVYHPSYAVLDCEISSSSSSSYSSSSSESISSSSSKSSSSKSSFSTSSISSTSLSSSSKSSLSSKSHSSASSSSSSSSSSLDSHSSSSESYGNVSTSSSSSFGGWNKTKPLILGMSAINAGLYLNRLAQTITIEDDAYSIGRVFCYFFGPYGTDNSYTIHLDVYTCDDDGKPLNILSSNTIPGSDITGNGWYAFDVNISGAIPANKYLSFVIWQENGNEDNYVLWGYNCPSDTFGTKAWFGSDGSVWTLHAGVLRALKIIGNFNAFDLDDFRIVTPPAEETITVRGLENGINDGTKYVKGGYQYGIDKVIIDDPPVLISFVVDSSGSMGWNDRYSTRQEFVSDVISKFKNNYSNNVIFDIVKFGATVATGNSIFANVGTPMPINLDLNNPDRSTYSFSVSSANATTGDVYANNGYSFVVSQTISSGTTLYSLGDGNAAPFTTGTLVKSSGVGDSTIVYNSFSRVSLSDGFVAYGFKSFEEDHNYNIGELLIDDKITSGVSLTNWQPLAPGGEVDLSIGANGPENSASLNFTASQTLTLRRPMATPLLLTTKIIDDAAKNDVTVKVEDISIFSIGGSVDFADTNIASPAHSITNVSSVNSTIDISPPLLHNILSWNNGGGIAQQSNFMVPIIINGTTAKLLVRDVLTSKSCTFFLQNANGLSMEWDFNPFSAWIIYNLFWLDETAILPVSVFDRDGNPFPDGTTIIFYVGSLPPDSTKTDQVPTEDITKDALVGSDKIYLASTEDFNRNESIDVLNKNNQVQTVTITEIGTDSSGNYIKFTPVLLYNFVTTDNSRIAKSQTDLDNANAASQISQVNLLPSSIGLVDVTPVYAGRNLDPSLLEPYDLEQVPPTINYDDLNLSRKYIQVNASDIPSIGGQACVRILPITEDNLKTASEKSRESAVMLRSSSPPLYTSQSEQESGDADLSIEDMGNAASSLTTTTTTLSLTTGEDYEIENPVSLQGGVAQSAMSTSATLMEAYDLVGMNVPGVSSSMARSVLAKKYTIYPAIVVEDSGKGVLARQFFPSFEIYFTPPVAVYSNYDGGNVSFVTQLKGSCPENAGYYTTIGMRGVYATGEGFKIDYVVTDKGFLSKSGTIKIRIYSNTIVDIRDVVKEISDSESGITITRQDLNYISPNLTSDIDVWRNAVENNPSTDAIVGVSSYTGTDAQGYKDTAAVEAAVKTLSGGENVSGALGNVSTESSGFYGSPWQWTKAVQYGLLQEHTIDIVCDEETGCGRASLVIPSSDVTALLMIQASVYFGDSRFEFIRSDLVAVANPIDVGELSPIKIMAQGGSTTYEIGASVTWKGSPIADNATVSFVPSSTPSLPSVSKMDNGWAGGVFLGPHALVNMTCPDPETNVSDCPCYGQLETVEITASYLGYQQKVSREIEWTGQEPSDIEDPDIEDPDVFYFFVDSEGGGWATGDSASEVELSIDLSNPINELWIGSDGIDHLKGLEQPPVPPQFPNGKPCAINVYSGTGDISLNQKIFTDGKFSATVGGTNANIGHQQPVNPQSALLQNPPWKTNVQMYTGYRYITPEGKYKSRTGTGATSYPYSVEGAAIIPYPQFTLAEPLGISLSLEAYNGEFIRDGIDSPYIVADVTWRGDYITSKYTKNEGKLDETSYDYPFPTVIFKAGTCKRINIVPGSDDNPSTYIDTRGDLGGCLEIEEYPDISLDSYSSIVSLSRTSIDSVEISEGVNGSHRHSCTVDNDGNGITNSTIVLSGASIIDHVHNISNYVVALSSVAPFHTHTLKSVAIVKLNPLINPNVNIAVNGYVVYDPTNCSPISNIPSYYPSNLPSGGRLMYSTVYINSSVVDRKLVLSLSTSDSYTAETVTDTSKGIDIVSTAYVSSYSIEDYPGHWVVVPQMPIPDGTRVVFEIDTFKALSPEETDSVLVVRPDAIRKYMYIRVKATAYYEDLSDQQEAVIIISSALQWLPLVKGLLIEPTNDDIYIAEALSNIETIGASQIHDAVKMAAQRIIQYQTDVPQWKTAKKAIFLLSDGDENTSKYSLDQATDNVNFIDGNCEVPVIPIRLGFTYSSDNVVMKKYAAQTCGDSYYLINATSSDIVDTINDIITSEAMGINYGTYTNTIDLGQVNLAASVSLENVLIPTGSRITFRIRFSADGTTWSSWSEWHDSSATESFPLDLRFNGRYFQYQVRLYGNDSFESPELYASVTLNHYKTQTLTVFFQPVDLDINSDEYLASIHITDKSTIPPTSTIQYGYTQFNSTDVADYYSVTRPLITPDRHTIILTRYNEIMLTNDYQKYTAINGRWYQDAPIEIWRISNSSLAKELVNPSEYAVNNNEGTITFYNSQNSSDIFAICVYFDPVFRIFYNVTNYGPNPVITDHIGILYNIAKRIPTDLAGNIIHTPIGKRI